MSNSTMKQNQAVYVATMNCLADAGIPFDDHQEGGVEKVVTKEIRANIIACVTNGLLSGEVEMSAEGKAKYDTEGKMRGYVSGLVSNWFRKDTRLNGNVKHTVKNPGSRAGAGDEQIKALKLLREVKADDAEAVAEIDKAIERRRAELKPTRSVELTDEQIALLPADLRAKLSL